MKKSVIKTLIAILLCLLVVGAVARALTGQAQAAPKGSTPVVVRDHCIDHREWLNASRSDKTRFEKSMGVYQDGRRVETQEKNIIVRYTWCNRTVDEGYYQVAYYKNKAGYWMAQYFSEWDFTKSDA